MCWNQYVSINTFLFSSFVLLLIIYNNKYSKYKIKELDNIYACIFLMSFFSMQLLEFFLWRNLENKEWNKLFSILGTFLLFLQPVASLMLIKDISLRIKMLLTYSIPAFSYFIYQINIKEFKTTVSKNGHLKWDWIDFNGFYKQILYVFWLFFLFFSLFINKHYLGLSYTIFLLIFTFYSYKQYGSFGSLWCWSINSLMLFYAIKLLLIMPFNEHGIC
jgi:hypothetical protein